MKKTVTVLIVALTVVLLVQAVGLAWMSDNGLSSPIDITSNVHKAYFESGDGSKETPYVIATPLQLYYFAWLQYLGYFNQDGDDEGTEIDTVYFTLKNDIDMYTTDEDGKPLQYVLPPIGTTDNPFVGNFDGAGHTVKNAVIENYYSSLIEPPNETTSENFKGVEIIGFFGVVGSLPEDKYTYDSSANEVKNLVLENLTVKTQTAESLIGLVAGYVNGVVDCVGVAGGTVNIKDGVKALSYTANISDYSLIGYCDKAYRDSVYVMDVVLSNPGITDKYTVVPEVGGDGDTAGWGGSIKMQDIFNLIQNVPSTQNTNYTISRTDVVGLDGTTVTVDRETVTRRIASLPDFGSFVFTQGDYGNIVVNYVAGAQKVTKFEYAYTENNVTVYYITDGTNYLCYNGTNITNTTDQANATKWYVSNGTNGGVISTVVNGSIYYLTVTNGAVSVTVDADPSNLPTWSPSGDTFGLAGYTRIICNNGNWTISGVKISSGNNYLTNNGTNLTNTTNQNNAATWVISSAEGGYTVSTVINGTTYYLRYTRNNYGGGGTFNLSQTPTIWQISNNRLSTSVTTNSWGGGTTTTTYYVAYNNSYYNSGWTVNNNGTALTFTSVSNSNVDIISSNTTAKEIVCSEVEYIDNSTENNYYDENGKQSTGAGVTYIPLSFSDTGYTVSGNNTGYIVGAQWGAIEKDEYDSDGNIRISEYAASRMSNRTTPLTMTYKTFKNSTAFQTIDATPTAAHLSTLGLQKYADCYLDFRSSVEDGSCYGLHFMQASVSVSNLMETTVYLNGERIENYQMPTNCIDFNLYDRGFINFVAGSYFTTPTTNDSFFSIYEVVRDENEKITAIKEIRKIYASMKNDEIDTGKPYYYTYRDGNNEVGAEGIPAGYEMVFDCHWITNPNDYGNWGTDKAFYFEVPVNAGEYAIGSTEGRTGAYLVYLDLAANAQLIERHKEYEKIEENNTAATIPNGVELLAPDETYDKVDPSDSVFVSINTSNVTTKDTDGVRFETEDGVTIKHSATGGTSAEYIGNNNVLLDGNGSSMSLQGVVTTIERTTYRDYNINTGETTVTVITKTTANGEVTYTRTITVTDADGNVTKDETTESKTELFPETKDTDTSPTLDVNKQADLVNLYFSYGQEVALTVTYLYVPAVTDGNGNVTAGAEYQITVTNPGAETVVLKAVLTEAAVNSGITVVINGQTLAANTNAQTVEIATTGGAVEEPAA